MGFRRRLDGLDDQVGLLRRLVRAVHAGEVLDGAGAGLFIQPLGVALHADLDGGIDEDFQEFALAHQLTRHAAFGAERRDEGGQHDQAGIHEQLGGLAHAADILHPVGIGEPQVLVQAMADIVAVQQIGVLALGGKLLFHQVGDGGLAGTRQAREPQDGRLLTLHGGAGLFVHVQRLPMHIGGAHQREINHAGADRGVGEAVNQDETAGVAIVAIGVEGQGLGQRKVGIADFVQRQGFGGMAVERVDVNLVLEARHCGRHRCGPDLQQILAAWQQFLVRHPQQMRGELVRNIRARTGRGQYVAARNIHFIGKGQRDGVTGHGFRPVAVHGDDAGDNARLSRLGDRDRVARLHAPAGDGAGEAAEIQVGPVDPLHRQAERRVGQRGVHIHRLQMRQQRRAAVPGRLIRFFHHIDAEARRDRDGDLTLEIQSRRELAEVRHDVVKHLLAVIHQVDLVHRQHDVADAQQRGDIGVAAGLGQHALARVNQDDGQIAVGGAGRHVAGILFVARRVGDDELALVGGEEAVGDINGDALLPLGFQPVHQQREINIVAVGAELLGVFFQRRQRVFEQELGVVQQAPDQGALAVIHAAAGEEAQQGFLFLRGQKVFQVDGGVHATLLS